MEKITARHTDDYRARRMIAIVFGILSVAVLAFITWAAWPNPSAPAGHPTGPVLQLPACHSEDGSGDVKPCMWNNPEAQRSGLTVINFPDGSWCYPTETTRGVWTNCVPEK